MLSTWIIKHFPEHRIYTEAFGGAGSVLLRKERCYSEVYNDIDGDLVNFFRVLRDPDLSSKLLGKLHYTPFSRTEYFEAAETNDEMDPVEPTHD